jgi:hypothetical protein
MKLATSIACLLLPLTVSLTAAQQNDDEPDLTVTQPLTQVEKTSAARLTRLPSVRLWWNEHNRIVAASLKGADANDRAVALCGRLPGLRALSLAALPQNQLTNNGLAPLASHTELRALSIAGDRLGDEALLHVQSIPTLETVVLQGNFTDLALELVAVLPELSYLDLTQCRVTDTGVAHIAGVPNLETLILNGTQVSNDCLVSVAELKRLTELYLGDTALDDGAIDQLATMEQLTTLYLQRTRITQEGIRRLLTELPIPCRVIHDGGIDYGERDTNTTIARALPRSPAAPLPQSQPHVPNTQWRAAR